MVNFFKSSFVNNLVATFTSLTLSSALIIPIPANAQLNVSINTINFGIKIEKIYEKIKKCIDKRDTKKIISHMFELKSEVESYSGQKIDLNNTINQVEKEARLKGHKINEKHFKAVKAELLKQERKHQHRQTWFADCLDLNIPYSITEADCNFEINNINAKTNHIEKQEEVPVKVMVGITVGLCGLFLIFVPLPGCQAAGGWLLNTGIGILGSEALDRWDNYDKEKKKK